MCRHIIFLKNKTKFLHRINICTNKQTFFTQKDIFIHICAALDGSHPHCVYVRSCKNECL